MKAESSEKQLVKENERLKQALAAAELDYQAQTGYVSQVAYNIRTPMNTISGMTAIARSNIENQEKVIECLDKIERSGRRMLEIVNEITVMLELNDCVAVLEEVPFDLSELMDKMTAGYREQMQNKSIIFRMEAPNVVHERLIGDRNKIEQILSNLLSNAIKYTLFGGTITVSVKEMHSFQGSYSLYRFIIEDTGIGMSEEFLQKMYRPFERAEDFRVSDEQGLGLGLTITIRAVRLMSGDMTVISKPESGTKFTVTLHIKRQEEQEPADKQAKASLVGKRMLIAEDNELNAEMIKELMEQNGVVVDVAENGLKVLDMLEGHGANYYDCVLMDIKMPVMSGYEATRKIRKSKREDLKKIPIIAMTAEAFSTDVKRARAMGMDAHIAKPLDVLELKEVFMKIL